MYQGTTLSITRLDNGLCELNFDNGDGSVNVFNRQTVNELSQALDHLEKSEGITGLLVTSGKNVFIVGADITEFTHAFSGDQTAVRGHMWPNNENFNRLEALPFPVVVAINGYALGGGFEFCLACDFRVMSSAAVAGFPEVSLGLIPGWGGTARTPRLAGFEKGVQWVAQGAHQNADTALNDGLVDAVASPETLRDDALALLEDAIAGKREYQSGRKRKLAPLDIDNADLSEQSEAALKQLTKQFGPHYPAHRVAVEVITKAASMVRDDALEAEFDAFIGLAQSPEGRALVGNFLNDQYMNSVAKKYASSATAKTRRAGVLGAGIMGGGIAWQNAYKGIPSVMKDIDQQALDQGMEEARGLLARQTSRGRLSEEQAESILNDIQPTLEYEPLADVDLVIEAVVEKEAVKKTVLSEVEALVEDDTLLASNTSSISISGLASALQRPENFCGIHFFNPVHAMPLVEVVRGDKTVDETVARAVAYVLTIGKKPVVVRDCPGFLVNRTLFMYFGGFHMLLREGADHEQLDQVMEQWGWPMGPAWLTDVVGLDIAVHAGDVVANGFPDRLQLDYQSATHLLLESGRYGQKNGKGYYQYEKDEKGRPQKSADPEVKQMLAEHAVESKTFSEDELVTRMMVPMATEIARCLEDGIVGSPQEADQALLYGLGFPRFRGGICRWMDETGLARICEMADQYAHLGGIYQPTDTMRRMAENGDTWYGS